MHLIIDPGALSLKPHAESVRSFLGASPENIVAFTDFGLQEAFNGADITGLRRTFAPIREFAPQIEVLRITPEICRLEPRSAGLRSRFVNELESNRLRTYLNDIFRDAEGVRERIQLGSQQAAQRIDSLTSAAPMVRRDILRQLKSIPKADMALLRKEGKLTAAIAHAVVRGVSYDCGLHFREIGFDELPNPEDVVHSFTLRFVLANYVLGLMWGVQGGVTDVAPKKLRNDVTDTSYAAYATFYDGLVTDDTKLEFIYRHTKKLLATLFNVQAGS